MDLLQAKTKVSIEEIKVNYQNNSGCINPPPFLYFSLEKYKIQNGHLLLLLFFKIYVGEIVVKARERLLDEAASLKVYFCINIKKTYTHRQFFSFFLYVKISPIIISWVLLIGFSESSSSRFWTSKKRGKRHGWQKKGNECGTYKIRYIIR